ncbi:MAG: glycosyltransferase [Sphaerochaeta sp.]|nr:glycosyltransferase [Sphaerochaeta sp.]
MSSIKVFVSCSPRTVLPPSPLFSSFGDEGSPYGVFAPLHEQPKALDHEYYGLCTGNLYLNFSKEHFPVDASNFVQEEYLNKHSLEKYALLEDAIRLRLEGVDMLVSEPVDVQKSYKNVSQMLGKQALVRTEDLQLFLALFNERHPQYSNTLHSYLSGTAYGNNSLFVMKQELFEEYCFLLFDLYDAFFEKTNTTEYTLMQYANLEVLGYLVTRVFFLQKMQEKRTSSILQCVQFSHVETPLSLFPTKEDAVVVVFASNEKFAPALGVCIQSMLEHIKSEHFYDVLVLESNLSEDSKGRLVKMCSQYQQVSLRFFNPTGMLSGRKLQKNATDHISMETYYRFLIADIFPSCEKVLYLDCDTVILSDVADLFATDLGDAVLGAALDPEIPGQLKSDDTSLASYFKEVLQMDVSDPYLQAGVLLLNLVRMRSLHSVDEWLGIAGSRTYRYNDQDILNKECKGHLHLLDLSWNVVVDCNHRRLPIIMQGPHQVSQAYLEARKHPKLIHYAGFEKPWDAPTSDFAYEFWFYASHCAFYDRLLCMYAPSHDTRGGEKQSFIQRLFPRGSKRRLLAKRWYYRLSGT